MDHFNIRIRELKGGSAWKTYKLLREYYLLNCVLRSRNKPNIMIYQATGTTPGLLLTND